MITSELTWITEALLDLCPEEDQRTKSTNMLVTMSSGTMDDASQSGTIEIQEALQDTSKSLCTTEASEVASEEAEA
jgi:hypothetical protein